MLTSKNLMLALLMSTVFGGGWVLAKSAMAEFPPILLASFRFGVAALALVSFTGIPRGRMKTLLTVSTLVISIPYSMSYTAMRALDVPSAVLLAQTEAPVLILLGYFMLGEKLRPQQMTGILIACGGVLIVAGDPILNGQYLAVILALGSVFAWALGQIRVRRLGDVGGLQNLAWLALFSAPQLFILSLLLESGQFEAIHQATPGAWIEVLYLGLIMTVVGMGIWYKLIGVVPLARIAPFLLLVPAVSIVGGVALLGEQLRMSQAVGGLAIIVGVFLTVTSANGNQRDPASSART
ncbi:DMT family transporter [Rhizobium leguminosarum]|uniref:DMT family transporter n=1 Tax=Rhizobium leguminosarum TaxID=384 RepID=UPI001C942B0C|nr:EamA family transporter [Rhizobium leguminosarum]MBY5370571.1 EamA family transporter [Rhizobium leguminosarum]